MKNISKILGVVLTIVLLCGCLSLSSGCGSETVKENGNELAEKENKETYTLTFVSSFDAGSTLFDMLEDFKIAIEELTDNRVEIKIVGGPEVFPPFEQMEAVSRGAVDGSLTTMAYYTGYMPEVNAQTVTLRTAKELVESGAIDLYREIHEKHNIFYLLAFDEKYGDFHFYLRNPIEKLSDLNGLRIRTAPGLYDEVLEELGAIPITTPHAEIYTALEQGLIDGLLTTAYMAGPAGYFDYAKYMLYPGFYRGGSCGIILNLDSWNNLPDDIRKIIDEQSVAISERLDEIEKKGIERNLQMLEEAGGKTIELSKEDAETLHNVTQDMGWDYVKREAPELGEKLEELFR